MKHHQKGNTVISIEKKHAGVVVMEDLETPVANMVFTLLSFHDPTSSIRAAVRPKRCFSSLSSDLLKRGWYVFPPFLLHSS